MIMTWRPHFVMMLQLVGTRDRERGRDRERDREGDRELLYI